MKLKFAVYAASAWVVIYPLVGSSQPTLDNLLKQCDQKTTVYGYDERSEPIPVGKTIDGYCTGFLEGALAVLQRSGAICLKETDASPTPEFLLSVVETYRSEGGAAEKDVALLIETAFKRAFTCRAEQSVGYSAIPGGLPR